MTITTLRASGASCRIHSFGATVLSFQSADGRENIFVSRDAKLDGSKAVRGGIPLVFPIFGPSEKPSTMPQHGFARVNPWKLIETTDTAGVATATYTLDLADVVAGRGENNQWSVDRAEKEGTDCKLTYEVRLEAQQLTTTLTAQNTGKTSFEMEALLHTYYAVEAPHDNSKTFVTGLGGFSITDKVLLKKGHIHVPGENVVLGGETDRDYHPPTDNSPNLLQTVLTNGTTQTSIEASGNLIVGGEGTTIPVSCVVWNPGKDKAASMSDMNNDAYEQMICVEPGILAHNKPTLQPGNQASLSQTIRVSSS
jgi:glucose-6-phosphate 1-epimerase